MSEPQLRAPSLDLGGGPPPSKPSIGGELSLSPTKLLTLPLQVLNPVKALKTLAEMVGASKGASPLDTSFKVTEQLSSLLRGNPKVFLNQAFGGGGAGASGPGDSLVGGATKAMGTALQKPTEMAGAAAGRGAGMVASRITSGVGSGLQLIPVVGTAAGLALKAAAPAIDQGLQQAGKVAGKVAGRLVKQAVQTATRAVRNLGKAVIQKAIAAGVRRGPQRVAARSTRDLPGSKPPALSVRAVARSIAHQVKLVARRVQGGVRKATHRAEIPSALGRRPLLRQGLAHAKSMGRFVSRTGKSALATAQAGAQGIEQLSKVGEHLGRGQVDEAGKALHGAGGAFKGAGRAAASPARETVGKAWSKSSSALRAVGRRPQVLRAGARSPGRPSAPASRPVTPGSLQALRDRAASILQTTRRVSRVVSRPVAAARAVGATAADITRGARALAQAPQALSRAGQSLAKGEASAALSEAHSGVSGLTAAPNALSSGASRIRSLQASRGTPKPTPPHYSQAGKALWGQFFQGD